MTTLFRTPPGGRIDGQSAAAHVDGWGAIGRLPVRGSGRLAGTVVRNRAVPIRSALERPDGVTHRDRLAGARLREVVRRMVRFGDLMPRPSWRERGR